MARVRALRDRVMRVAVRGWLAGGPLPGASDIHDAPAASESPWLRLYGAAAMAALMVFRLLFPGHVARAWRARKNPGSGLSMLCPVLLLVVTGYPSVHQHGSLDHRGAGGLRPCATRVHGQASSQSPPMARGLHRRLFDAGPSGTEGPSGSWAVIGRRTLSSLRRLAPAGE